MLRRIRNNGAQNLQITRAEFAIFWRRILTSLLSSKLSYWRKQHTHDSLTRSVNSNVGHCLGRRNRLLDEVMWMIFPAACRREFHQGLSFSALNDI